MTTERSRVASVIFVLAALLLAAALVGSLRAAEESRLATRQASAKGELDNVTYVIWRVEVAPGDVVHATNPFTDAGLELFVTEAGNGERIASGQTADSYLHVPAREGTHGFYSVDGDAYARTVIVTRWNQTGGNLSYIIIGGGPDYSIEVRRPTTAVDGAAGNGSALVSLPAMSGLDFVWVNRTGNLSSQEQAVLSESFVRPSFAVIDGDYERVQKVLLAIQVASLAVLVAAAIAWIRFQVWPSRPQGESEAVVELAQRAKEYLGRLRVTLWVTGVLIVTAAILGFFALQRWMDTFAVASPAGWTQLLFTGYAIVVLVVIAVWSVQLFGVQRELRRWAAMNAQLDAAI